MKYLLNILVVTLIVISCNHSKSDNLGEGTSTLPQPSIDSTLLVGDYLFVSKESSHIQSFPPIDSGIQHLEPRIMYVIYGYYCGECDRECTKMYKHYLIGNATTFWTDETDSYFKDGGLKFETKMTRESEQIGFELINEIPESIFKSDNIRNIFGCLDCDDGCGLYFEFQLDEPGSKPIVYGMEYSLSNATGDIMEFGELIKNTIDKLEKYR